MSNQEELPGIPPSPPPPKGPIFRRLFGRWKWPGWATLALGTIRAFHLSEDVDFALTVLRSLGGGLEMFATVIASPFFALAMVTYGVLHLVFVGEPKQATRHYAAVYIGWSVFGAFFLVLTGAIGYGLVQAQIEKEVGKRDEQLQQQYAVRPVFWHLTDIQKTALAAELDKVPEADRFDLNILCLPDAGSRAFVDEIGGIFLAEKWKAHANCMFSDLRPDFVGLAIGIAPTLKDKKSLSEYPKNIQTLAKVLSAAQIPASWAFAKDGTKEDDFSLVVGNAP